MMLYDSMPFFFYYFLLFCTPDGIRVENKRGVSDTWSDRGAFFIFLEPSSLNELHTSPQELILSKLHVQSDGKTNPVAAEVYEIFVGAVSPRGKKTLENKREKKN